MKPNLDSLKGEIQEHLEQGGFAVFYGYSRMLDTLPLVYWDTERYPEYKAFVDTARRAGVKMMVFHEVEFSSEQVENALERLQGCELSREDYRSVERRLKEIGVYEGFTCALELSFDFEGRIYVFDLRTDWYEEFTDLMEDLHVLSSGNAEEQEDEEDNPMGGYFSKN